MYSPKNGFGWFILAIKRCIEFNGRSSRSEFWYFELFSTVFNILGSGIDHIIGITFFKTILTLVFIIPSIAVSIRRLHDINRSGWWGLFPIVNIFFFIQKSDPSTNRFGSVYNKSE